MGKCSTDAGPREGLLHACAVCCHGLAFSHLHVALSRKKGRGGRSPRPLRPWDNATGRSNPLETKMDSRR
eukprot:5494495-Pyramimonas_sp.AAC.1